MFCPKCGTQLPDTTDACSSCGTVFAASRPAGTAFVAGDKMKGASKDAFGAFRTFATNPVGALPEAYAGLGSAKAMGVGITFGVVFAICILLSIYRVVPEFIRPTGVGGFLKILVIAVVPFIALFASTVAVRTVFRGDGEIGSDSFLAGAALLPFGFVAILTSLLGPGNFEVIYFLSVFAVTLTILMLFAGLTQMYKITERASTLAIPMMLVATAWLSKVIYAAMLL